MNRILWAVQGLLAGLFLFAGVAKLITPVEVMTVRMKLPGPLLHFVGVAEVTGALGLILPWALRIKPWLTPLAALGLSIIMVGAVITTLVGGMGVMALFPGVTGALTLFVARGRRVAKS